MEFKSKKAIVFGGTSGIGLATVKQLVDLGADVIAVGRSKVSLPELSDKVSFKQCDVLDKEALQALFAELGTIDILVSAATGGSRAVGPFAEMDMEGYQASFAKLWGYTNVVRYGLDHLSQSGAIVLVSGSPARRCNPGQIAISSVGGAVEAFVRGVAKEITPIRINAVSPGLIDTPMWPQEGDDRKTFSENSTANNLIPRIGTSEEVAQGIIFAIQNDFVTGTSIDVDGGILLS